MSKSPFKTKRVPKAQRSSVIDKLRAEIEQAAHEHLDWTPWRGFHSEEEKKLGERICLRTTTNDADSKTVCGEEGVFVSYSVRGQGKIFRKVRCRRCHEELKE